MESFIKVLGLLGYFEEHLAASVPNTINSQNFVIIRLQELTFYFTTICVKSCSLELKKWINEC